jgi:hypothetical protein
LDSRLGLPRNTILDGSYRIERVIGSGGFGVTYRAEDINLKTLVALKEYYPIEFGERDRTMNVRPKSDRHRQTFDWGRTSFLQEAQMLARFRHPSIVRVTRVFEANSTAYMVMDFEQGQSFEDWLRDLGRLPTQAELDRILAPLLAALETMHAAAFLHRDIAPDNILIRGDGTPVLLDFGAARRAVAERSRALTGIVKAGYSPHEQYAADSRLQGPWTDLYALGATFYRAIAGHQPEEATLRFTDDRMQPAAEAGKGTYESRFLAAIDACLRVLPSRRPQSVAELQVMLRGQERAGFTAAASESGDLAGRQPNSYFALQQAGARRWLGIAAAAVALLGGAYGGLEYARRHSTAPEPVKRAVDVEAEREASRRQEEARREAEAREAERRETARRKAEDERRAEEEAKRRADAEAARRKSEEEALAPIRIAAPTSWNNDCVSDPLPRVTVITEPKHGRIEFKGGKIILRRISKGSPKCLGTEQSARIVNYVPNGPPVDADQVSLSIFNVRGSRYIIDCTVRAIERKSECKARQ